VKTAGSLTADDIGRNVELLDERSITHLLWGTLRSFSHSFVGNRLYTGLVIETAAGDRTYVTVLGDRMLCMYPKKVTS
jgi:hypothetical protein